MQNIEYVKLGTTDGYRDTWKFATTSDEVIDAWCKEHGAYARAQTATLTIFETLEEFQNHTTGEAKRKALAKLTLEDKKALGLI